MSRLTLAHLSDTHITVPFDAVPRRA